MITVRTTSAKEEVDSKVYQELKKLETDDFQNRGDNYPRSGVPVDISCDEHDIAFSFKNTSIKTAVSYVERYLTSKGFKVANVKGFQDGDYVDDWVTAYVRLSDISLPDSASKEDLRGWGDEEIANQNALSSIAEAIKQSFNEAGITYGAFDFDIFDTGSTICIQGVENPQEVIEFLEENFEFPVVDEGENYVVIDTIQEYEDEDGKVQTRINTNYLTNEEPDEDAEKLARIKEEIYYYLGREVSDEEALEVLDFAEAKPDTDLSAIVSDYFNQ